MSSNRSNDPSQFLAYLHDAGNVFEVRIPDCPDRKGGNYKSTAAGFFNDPDKAAEAIAAIEQCEPASVYVTINPANPEVIARACNRIKTKVGTGFSAGDDKIVRRRNLLIDIDPSRVSGISSTDEAMQAALTKAADIREYLSARGWPLPLFGMSGNGAYLIYSVDLPNDDASTELVKSVLEALAFEFDNDALSVDCSTSNASRICAVLGTWKRKGDDVRGIPGVPDRPHRRSWFEVPDDDLQIVPVELLKELAALAPVDPEPVSTNTKGYSSSFDVVAWMREKNISHDGGTDYKGRTRYRLDACPFNSDHVGKDVAVFQGPDGKLGFKCFHNSCRANGWQAVREKFDGPKEERYKQQIEPGVNRLVDSMLGKSVQAQVPGQKLDTLPPLESVSELVAACPVLKPAIVENILRQAEVLNINAQSKIGKSFMGYQLGYSIVAGLDWLSMYSTTPTNVLLVDNELHRETLAYRLPYVAKRLGLEYGDYAGQFKVNSMRGRLRDIFAFEERVRQIEASDWKPGVIVLDAFYRLLPAGYSENDNAQMAEIYNAIDSYAERLNCAFVLIHHSTKGSQAEKRVTDVGSGASAMGRAADAHLVLREHEEPGVIVLDAALRSWRQIEPVCLRWDWPLFVPDDSLDPKALKRERGKVGRKQKDRPECTTKPVQGSINAEKFAQEVVGPGAMLIVDIFAAAKEKFDGMGQHLAKRWLDSAIDKGLVFKLPRASTQPQKYSTTKPNAPPESAMHA
jgi:hypothetical protein